ncbi:MAG: hypothetical protein NUW01_17590, partial [Gemmatimonadaceae bacterium]|nr:hypothetical protein [Gemmatimonadaceae bacterium]
IEVSLAAVSALIAEQRAVIVSGKAKATAASVALAEIPTKFADVIATVQAFGTGNAYEANVKAKFAKLATEYAALKTSADNIVAVTV